MTQPELFEAVERLAREAKHLQAVLTASPWARSCVTPEYVQGLEQRLAQAEESLVATRANHAKLCRGIRSVLGLEHWPEFQGNFHDTVLQLLADGFRNERDAVKQDFDALNRFFDDNPRSLGKQLVEAKADNAQLRKALAGLLQSPSYGFRFCNGAREFAETLLGGAEQTVEEATQITAWELRQTNERLLLRIEFNDSRMQSLIEAVESRRDNARQRATAAASDVSDYHRYYGMAHAYEECAVLIHEALGKEVPKYR